jgi:hypothetical protein
MRNSKDSIIIASKTNVYCKRDLSFFILQEIFLKNPHKKQVNRGVHNSFSPEKFYHPTSRVAQAVHLKL